MTDTHPEKLGSSGPCTLVEIHQQPRNLAQEMYEPGMVVHAYNTSTQETGAGRSGVQGQLQLHFFFFKLAWASQTKLGTKAIQVVASLGQGILLRGQFGLYSKTVSKKTTTREGRNF